MTKFSKMTYTRPDVDTFKAQVADFTKKLENAQSYAEAKEIFLAKENADKHLETMFTLVSIRHSIDTRDEFYTEENNFMNTVMPEVEEYENMWTKALLDSAFRADFEAEYGKLMFLNSEISARTFSPEMIPLLQKENELSNKYEDLLASAKIPFEGKIYTIAQMTPFKSDADDERRLAAWKAEGQWYKDNQAELDSIYDELVHLRTEMGKMLGYEDYTPLGYDRMQRNCYTKEDVERFRAAVRKYLVPVAAKIYEDKAKRFGKSYPMSFADNALSFRSGNPRPVGTAEDVLNMGLKFYKELSPETDEFFTTMMNCELLDVLAKEGKQGGGYCTSLPDYEVPFIFANFNGTQGDVEVVTHEAGHAFASWMNRSRTPKQYVWPSLEACEVHSMSMEFMAWPWEEGFFGKDADKFRYSHLADCVCFIPYGTMVDHFQHEVYAKPDMTPAERHAVWKELLGIYMPWMKLDGEIPFYSEGEGWQRQHHIYSSPFYYIDYCLAQTCALELWAMSQIDFGDAWKHYMDYTVQGGTQTFTDLLKNAGLETPFDENCLKLVCETANAWLETVDVAGLE